MSGKRDEDGGELDDGLTTSERRRRRRRGGIRIPSDNVPRRTGSQPVITPVPEDPALAVSIAYAFGDEQSAPHRVAAVRHEDAVPAGLEDLDDATHIAAQPPMPDGSVPMPIDDIVPDGRTRQMPAISLEALGLSALDPDALADPATTTPMPTVLPTRTTGELEAVDIDVDESGDPASDVTADSPLRADHADGVPRAPMTRAHTVALSEDDLEELLETTANGAAPTPPPTRTRPPTAPPAVPAAAPPPTPPPPVEAIASGTERGARIERPEPPQLPERVKPKTLPSLPTVGPPATAAPQPTTPPATPPMQAAPPPPAPQAASQPAAPPPAPASAAPTAPAAPPPAVLTTAATATAIASTATDDDGDEAVEPVDAADVEITGEPSSVADAGDSGEILAEEILEVEEQQRAPAVDALFNATTTPGAQAAAAAATAAGAAAVAAAATPERPAQFPTYPTLPVVPPPTPHKAPPPAPAKKSVSSMTQASSSPPEDKRKRRGRPWFEEIFDEDYLRTLPFLTPQATQAEATMVVDSLGLAPGAQVLDLGCGYGRHAMELAARGLHVVGVDLSMPMLVRGADEAQRRGLDINFVHTDMRELDFEAQFDGAYCLFSTFGYFDDETNKKTASLVARALRPGAKFMLEVLNRDYVIGDLPNRVWWEGDGCVVLEEVEFNYFSSRVQSKRSVVFDDGRQVEQEISLRVYSLHEIGKLLHAAGLRVVEVSGSMVTKGRFLGNRSREIIVIAERKSGDVTKG